LKRIGIVTAVISIITLSGCSQSNIINPSSNSNSIITELPITKESKYPFPTAASLLGNGRLIIRTSSGTSEGGNIPILFVSKDTVLTQVGIDLLNWEGNKEVFLYIDKIFIEARQGGMRSQTSLSLVDDFLKPGIYKVSAIQFENNDPNSKIIGYQEAIFEVKSGS